MHDTGDDSDERSERVPVRIPIELRSGDFDDAFRADALNLSKGGLSLRAACLPDPGSRLVVRFRCEPSGALITAEGEVVWAHLDSEQRGEFGLAFVGLDTESEWLIDEMIAEQRARSGDEVAAPVAQLELEGSSEPIAARVAYAAGGHIVFEQPLELLKLGRGVRAHGAGAADAKPGSIAGVELRMVGSVPMLAVTVAFGSAVGRGAPQLPEHDTEPDMVAPPELASDPQATLFEFNERKVRGAFGADERAQRSGAHAGGRAASHAAHAAEPQRDPDDPHERPTYDPAKSAPGAAYAAAGREIVTPVAEAAPYAALHARAAGPARVAPNAVLHAPPSAPPGTAGRMAAQPPSEPHASEAWPVPQPVAAAHPKAERADFSGAFTLEAGQAQDIQLELPAFEPDPSALQVALTRMLVVVRRRAAAIGTQLFGALGSAQRKATPEVRAALLRAGGGVRGVYREQLGPQLGAARRLLFGRRRRTTGGPAQARAAQSSGARGGLGRTVLLGLLAALAVGLGVYALAPAGSRTPAVHRALQPSAPPLPSTMPVHTDTAAVDLNGVPALVPPDPSVVPNAHSVPASSPFAVDVRKQAAVDAREQVAVGARKQVAVGARKQVAVGARKAAASTAAASEPASAGKPAAASGAGVAPATDKPSHALRFGAAKVPHGRRFTLQMSGKVQSIDGSADEGGFTVFVAGCLALDRAGPISSAHGAVERSMILNRGDHAELTIRFADGKQPAYQVVAEGSTLVITIEDV